MARIWVDTCDVLIVDEIEKNFSGDGMYSNITGTFLNNCINDISIYIFRRKNQQIAFRTG